MGGATKLYGAALYRLRREDFGELQHHDGVSPAWPISYDDIEPYYTQAEQLLRGARRPRRGPDRAARRARRTRSRRSPTSPGSSSCPTTSQPPATTRSTRPCGVMLDEANLPYSTCVRCGFCDGFPCPLHAKSDAEVHGVRPALLHPNVTLLTNATAVRLDTDAAGRAVTEVEVDHEGAREVVSRRHRGRVVRGGEHRQAAAGVGQRPAPERPGQRLRPGRPQLHVPQQPGGARPVAGAEPDGLPEDARRQRLLLRHRRLRLPDGQHPDGRQVDRGDVPGREADRDEARADLRARATSPPTPSTSGSRPRTCPGPTTGSPSSDDGSVRLGYEVGNQTRRASGCTTSSSRCSATSACTPTT